MKFGLGNDKFPLQIQTNAGEQPLLKLEWGFKLAFGVDETG